MAGSRSDSASTVAWGRASNQHRAARRGSRTVVVLDEDGECDEASRVAGASEGGGLVSMSGGSSQATRKWCGRRSERQDAAHESGTRTTRPPCHWAIAASNGVVVRLLAEHGAGLAQEILNRGGTPWRFRGG